MAPRHYKDDPVNDLGDFGSMIFSGVVAGVVAPGLISTPFLFVGVGAYVGSLTISSAVLLATCAVRSTENERSVGGLFNRPTGWTIPTGLSWWFPKPLGQKLQPRRVDQMILARRKDSPSGSIPQVQTADGGQVEVQVTLAWRIVDVVKTQRIPEAELVKRVEGLLDRQVRYFALGFESDAKTEANRLMNQKLAFSGYIVGDSTYLDGGLEKPIQDKNGKHMLSDIKERCDELGIAFERAEVHDINPPQEVIDARNKQAAEAAEGQQEQEDVASMRNRILELMWKTSHAPTIAKYEKNGKTPLMTVEAATLAVRAARKDVTDVNVSGGGDFTKAEVLRSAGLKRK
jgi:regulator of protease activity HflC (stomatin/prohibitin superfamily)